MARTFNGSDTGLNAATAPVTGGPPCTLAAWIRPASVTINQAALFLGNSGDSNHLIYILGRTDGDVNATHRDGSGTIGGSAFGAGALTLNAWHHLAGVFAATNSRTVYLNGTAGTPNSNALGSTSLDMARIGDAYDSFNQHFNGDIAEAAFWNVALTQAELTALAAGVSPLLIRPQALVSYTPLVRGSTGWKGTVWSEQGTIGTAAHPRVYYPKRGRVVATQAAGDAIPVSASITGAATVAFGLTAAKAVVFGASATSAATATVAAARAIALQASGTSSATASASARRAVVFGAASAASVTASLNGARTLSALATSTSALTATLTRLAAGSNISAAVAASAIVTATIAARRPVVFSALSTSTVAADLDAVRAVLASVTATSQASVSLTAAHALSATIGLSTAVSVTLVKDTPSTTLTGKYAAEHAAARQAVLGVARGFASEHATARGAVRKAGGT